MRHRDINAAISQSAMRGRCAWVLCILTRLSRSRATTCNNRIISFFDVPLTAWKLIISIIDRTTLIMWTIILNEEISARILFLVFFICITRVNYIIKGNNDRFIQRIKIYCLSNTTLKRFENLKIPRELDKSLPYDPLIVS